VLSYRSGIDLSSRTLRFAAGVLRRHRRLIGSRWRKLNASRQALQVLAHLRCGDTYARLAAGFGVGVTTVHRYVAELVDLLAADAPDLAAAVQAARRKAYVVLDGTLIATDRVGMRTRSDKPYYSGKHKRHAVNVQVLTDPAGRLLWASPALPGSIHDVKAARRHGLIHALTGRDVPVLADRGYQGAPAAPSASPSAAGTCPPDPPQSTPATPGYAHPANADPPPSRPGDSSTACTAAPNAAPPSSPPSSPSKPPTEPKVGKGS
jgi:hypothetical protein